MATVFIANLAVVLPSRFAAGDILNETAAAVLNDIHRKRLTAKLRYLHQKGDINKDGLQSKALELASLELVPYTTLDDEDGEPLDPILEEALSMARNLIITRMAEEGLPPPKGLESHAKALVDAMPGLQEKARLRVEARYQAAALAMGGQ